MPQHQPPLNAHHLLRAIAHAAAPIPRDASLIDAEPLSGSRPIGPDAPTLGGLPEAALEERRARRESGAQTAELPTQPIAAVPAQDTAEPPPPSRKLALSIAHGYTAGHVPAGRAASEAMARFIRAQPDYQGTIDEWLIATVAVERMRVRGDSISPLALVRMDDAERALAALSSLDRRFAGTLDATLEALRNRRSLPDVLTLDPPTAATVTDLEILALARSFGDGTASDSDGRATCMIALGVCGPIPRRMEIIRGATREEVIAQARAWCVAKIHELAQASRIGSDPDPIDGPQRYRWAAPPRDHNRARIARELAGLSFGQAARLLGWHRDTLTDVESSADLTAGDVAAMARLYQVSPEWLTGDVPQRDYAVVDAIRGSDKLSPGDRDMVAELAASIPRDHRTIADRIWAAASATSRDLSATDPAPTPRIFTPRDDGSCAVCGELLCDHDVDVDDGCPVAGARSCPAVAP